MLLCKYKPTYSKCKLTKKLHILSPMATLPESPRYRPNLPLSGTSHQIFQTEPKNPHKIHFSHIFWPLFVSLDNFFFIFEEFLRFDLKIFTFRVKHTNVGDLPDFHFFRLASLVLCLGFKQACTSF